MDAISVMTNILVTAGGFSILSYCLYRALLWVRRRNKRARVIETLLTPFIVLGEVMDPTVRIVREAKQHKKQEEDNPGDPPNPEDEGFLEHAAATAARRENVVRTVEVVMTRTKVSRPAPVWVITIALGLMAVLTSLVLSWIVLSDPALLAPPARNIRESMSAFDWGSLYLTSAMLLASMILLFRLRKSCLWLFLAYLVVGTLLSAGHAITPGQEPYFEPRVTMLVGIPLATAVFAYMLRLKRRAKLV